MNLVEAYLSLLYIVALLIVPVAGYATVFAWRKVREFGAERPGLMLVLAVVSTIAFVGSTYIGILILARLSHVTMPAELAPVTVTVFVAFEAIPIIVMGYLIWRERQAGDDEPGPR